jgi:hypothetical protein
MNPSLQRALTAYRPLHQRGLLMDGQYRWPGASASHEPQPSVPSVRTRQRTLLVAMTLAALTGLRHMSFFHGSKS